ncbi:hypothetical protein GFS31_36970 [Leptolyngbya sp. BL0902]|uniref:hypothetical protein n=1 Tax=Leptolyngbya sp. BL0902 TaxID=1115757 RepID=UPI0018E716C1|nr:hypothetical protein [Leptolyngbya sp. BL0902]QQE66992.1 hypothetical protein GFS31_36970 [Leptolyngbya sp. BL0902]
MSIQPVLTIAKIAAEGGRTARSMGLRWRRVGLSLLLGLMVASCRTAPLPEQATSPPPTSPPPTEPAPPVEPPPTPAPSPDNPVPQAPSTTSPVQRDPLPDALVKQWEPMSNVLLAFGPMTITSGDITWGSGQTSPYTLISTEGGFLLKLEANPQFYDTNHPFVKLIPNTDASGTVTTVEVAFYEDEAQAQRDEYMMYGTYFVN